ncbi:hypothetical protein V474_24610 [Novosphingobium barchaimii LL02]|uniref:Uncharacterized protein n=1 Tax=Novosphingobium barchaimii LL02 TaxID=1114963 RepID=A0A0J7XNR1_9SPHN|nr:hypothetical protein [Novosphingobium barchaimii]KMS52728.1 hypothetical protein V474_24610 [Novosphingobium barchaimii LL02]
MVTEQVSASRGGITSNLLLAGCVGLLALPSAVLAFSTNFQSHSGAPGQIDSLDPETSPENLSRAIAMRSLAKGQQFPFTPAGTPNRQDRAVTVAVRVDPEAAQAIIVHGRSPMAQAAQDAAPLRIASTAFNLGVSRGYQNFAQNLVPQTPARPIAELPDLKKFSLAPGTTAKDPSRFSPRISIDEKRTPGRAPRTFSGEAGEVELGGAYRVTENLDVTAGVRYSQDRERLVPLTDGKLDGQAVYVGTQFKF